MIILVEARVEILACSRRSYTERIVPNGMEYSAAAWLWYEKVVP